MTTPQHGRVGFTGRWIAAALGAVVVLVGATVAVTLAVAGGGSTPSVAAARATTEAAQPTTTGPAAAGQGSQPTPDALISNYVQAIDNAQNTNAHNDAETQFLQFLCGGTGPGPDTAVGWSWVFVMLHEQLQPGPQQIVQSRTVVPLTVLSRGQQSGSYLAVLDHRSTGWCLLGLGE